MPSYEEYTNLNMNFDDFWDFMVEVDRLEEDETNFEMKVYPLVNHLYQVNCTTSYITSDFSSNMIDLFKKYNFEKI